MIEVAGLAFASPWLLLGLLALPILWWVLRATPPSAVRERFPGVVVLLGLEPPEKTPERTPWWLLLLRLLIAALAILAFAEPLMNARDRLAGSGPLRIVMDGGWASAADWESRRQTALDIVEQAASSGRPVELISLAEPPRDDGLLTATDAAARIEAARPRPWGPDRSRLEQVLTADGDVVWFHDGLSHGDLASLPDTGFTAIGPVGTARALRPLPPEAGSLSATVLRAETGFEETLSVVGYEASPDGTRRALAVATAQFGRDETSAEVAFDVPLELRNRIGQISLERAASAGGSALLDDRWRRKRIGIVSSENTDTGRRLLSGSHYVREALAPIAELREGEPLDLLNAGVDALVAIDIGAFSSSEEAALLDWITAGGLLVRFAGPTLAAATDDARAGFGPIDDPLLPVRLRSGGRDLGGAMSWGTPQDIAPFAAESPFAGLEVPPDAQINRQVLAEPDIDLPLRTWARLADGAPLVTAQEVGNGRLVLFHTSAAPTWSNLPYTGLFVEMLERVAALGTGAVPGGDTDGALWTPVAVIDSDGVLRDPPADAKAIDGDTLAAGVAIGAGPGLFEVVTGAGEGTRRALNVIGESAVLTPLPAFPPSVTVETLGEQTETRLKPWLLTGALLLLLLDAVAALALAGKLRGAVAAALAAMIVIAAPPKANAQIAEDKALRAALDGALAYVLTGNEEVDEMTRAGLFGLGLALTERTAVEPPPPVGVDLEADDLSVYPFVYWAVVPDQATPSPDAIAKLNGYMRRGGMLILDSRDQNLAFGGAETPGTRALRRLTVGLDLPALAPVPAGHVLGRTFYLLDDFLGRWTTGGVWVQAQSAEDIEVAAETGGFKNDGVSPVLVGGRDWAAAWAVDEAGRPLVPVGDRTRPRQREWALRFGVNLVLYAYTGSYKSDQVHIPTLLQRMGN